MAAANGSASTPKYTLSQISHTVDRFIKVLKIDTERLEQHKTHIHKYKVLEDWLLLNKEQINASRSVQQLKSNIQELSNTRRQIRECDQPLFDKKVEKVQSEAQTAIVELLDLRGYTNFLIPQDDHDSSEPTKPRNTGLSGRLSNEWLTDDSPQEDSEKQFFNLDEHGGADKQQQVAVQQHMLEEQRLAEESWENLRQSCEDLNETFEMLSRLVHEQQDTVDSIEDNLERASEDVTQGTQYLAQAAKWKAAMLPVAGALIGGIIGGPIGLVAGLKIGGAAGLVGGVAGAAGGRFIQKKKSQSIDSEMAELKTKTSETKTLKPELSLDDLKISLKKT